MSKGGRCKISRAALLAIQTEELIKDKTWGDPFPHLCLKVDAVADLLWLDVLVNSSLIDLYCIDEWLLHQTKKKIKAYNKHRFNYYLQEYVK